MILTIDSKSTIDYYVLSNAAQNACDTLVNIKIPNLKSILQSEQKLF